MKKWIFGALGVLVVLTVAGVAAFWFWVQHYLASAEFQALVERQLGQALSAECTLMPLRWNGLSVYSDGMDARGFRGGAFHQLRASQLRAELNFRGLLSGRWEISEVEAQQAEVDFDPAAARPEPPPVPAAANARLAGLLPREVLVRKIGVREMSMKWTRPGTSPVEASKVTLSLEPDGASWKIEAAQGDIKGAWGPVLELVRAKLRLHWPELFVSEAELRPEGQGTIRLSGETAFEPDNRLDLHVDLENLPLEKYLPEDWRARLTGKLQGQMEVTGRPDKPESLKAEGTLEILEGRLEALPILERIAVLTKTREFRSLRLHHASAKVEWTLDELRLSKILLESEAVLRIEGNLARRGPQLDGLLEVGTTPAVLRAIPGAEAKVFTRSADGYVWARPAVKVSGTLDAPEEDLSSRLKAAVVDAVKDDVVNTLENLWDKAKSVLPVAP